MYLPVKKMILKFSKNSLSTYFGNSCPTCSFTLGMMIMLFLVKSFEKPTTSYVIPISFFTTSSYYILLKNVDYISLKIHVSMPLFTWYMVFSVSEERKFGYIKSYLSVESVSTTIEIIICRLIMKRDINMENV